MRVMSGKPQQQYKTAIFSQLAHNAAMLNQLTGTEPQVSNVEQEMTLRYPEISMMEADIAQLKQKISRIETKLVVMKWLVWTITIGVIIDLCKQLLCSVLNLV